MIDRNAPDVIGNVSSGAMTCHIDWTRESNFSSVLSAGITRYRVGAMMRWCGGLPVRLFGRGDDLDGSCILS